jgi:hypothetical protein
MATPASDLKMIGYGGQAEQSSTFCLFVYSVVSWILDGVAIIKIEFHSIVWVIDCWDSGMYLATRNLPLVHTGLFRHKGDSGSTCHIPWKYRHR